METGATNAIETNAIEIAEIAPIATSAQLAPLSPTGNHARFARCLELRRQTGRNKPHTVCDKMQQNATNCDKLRQNAAKHWLMLENMSRQLSCCDWNVKTLSEKAPKLNVSTPNLALENLSLLAYFGRQLRAAICVALSSLPKQEAKLSLFWLN